MIVIIQRFTSEQAKWSTLLQSTWARQWSKACISSWVNTSSIQPWEYIMFSHNTTYSNHIRGQHFKITHNSVTASTVYAVIINCHFIFFLENHCIYSNNYLITHISYHFISMKFYNGLKVWLIANNICCNRKNSYGLGLTILFY